MHDKRERFVQVQKPATRCAKCLKAYHPTHINSPGPKKQFDKGCPWCGNTETLQMEQVRCCP